MKTCANCNCQSLTLSLNPETFTPDKRLPLVERILGILVESRFGLDRVAEPLKFCDGGSAVYAGYLDLHPPQFSVPVKWSKFSDALGKVVSFLPIEFRERSQTSSIRAASLMISRSPSTLGRGSPQFASTP